MLDPQQQALLQWYAQKNRVTPQMAQAQPVQLPQAQSAGGDFSSIMQTLGGIMGPNKAPMQGPLQIGQERPMVETPNMFQRIGDQMNPQTPTMNQQDMQVVMQALARLK